MSGTMRFFNLGGSIIPGSQPKSGLIGGGSGSKGWSGMVGSSARGTDRSVLRKSFGNNAWIRLPSGNFTSPVVSNNRTTPFRAALNAGDTLGTVNESPSPLYPGSNQLNGKSISLLNIKSGGVRNNGTASYSGNPKYVYDGSDYTRYKKLKAVNRTYNDSSFGGSNNGAYVVLSRVRH